MGMSYRRYLAGARVYGCLSCRTHLTTIHSMISRVSAVTAPTFTTLMDLHAGIQWAAWPRLFVRRCVSLDWSAAKWSVLTSDVRRVNVIEGEPNDRQMTTGNHTVRDIYCCKCGTTLGWKYVRKLSLSNAVLFFSWNCLSRQDKAYEQSQKYKEGKYILERNLLVDVQ